MGESVRRLLCAAVLLPALLVTVAGAGFAGWRCHGLGLATVHASRCCPGPGAEDASRASNSAQRDRAGESPARIAGQRCCELTQVRPLRVPSELARAETLLIPPVASNSPGWALAPTAAGAAVASGVAHRPSGGLRGSRAVLLSKQSFLI